MNIMFKYLKGVLGNPLNPKIEIAGREIGYDYDHLIITEIGINHGGSLEVAFEMVDTAAEVGTEIIKHQTHIA
jgi:sialic acid synthase SpsE